MKNGLTLFLLLLAEVLAREVLDAIAAGKSKEVHEKYFTNAYQQELPLDEWLKESKIYQDDLGKVLTMVKDEVLSSAVTHDGQSRCSLVFHVTWEKATRSATVGLVLQGDWKITNIQINPGEVPKKLPTIPPLPPMPTPVTPTHTAPTTPTVPAAPL